MALYRDAIVEKIFALMAEWWATEDGQSTGYINAPVNNSLSENSLNVGKGGKLVKLKWKYMKDNKMLNKKSRKYSLDRQFRFSFLS